MTVILMKTLGLYIHVPFCIRKCPYCDFYSVALREDLRDRYVHALQQSLSFYRDPDYAVDTVYFGGGTPSLLSPEDIDAILSAASRSFSFQNPEVTMEANPSTVTLDKLSGYHQAGVNRLSFGVQSFNDDELKDLGRLHDAKTAEDAVNTAKRAGFRNISADLMLGISRQTEDSLQKTLHTVGQLDLQHISAYMLSMEPNTPYARMKERLLLPNEDKVSDLYLMTVKVLKDFGFSQYEISNFSKPGFESQHNLKYWNLEEYLGLGPSAHSLFHNRRAYFPEALDDFLSMAETGSFSMSEEGSFDPAEEYIMLSLRLCEGLHFSRAEALGIDVTELLEKAQPFLAQNLLSTKGDRLFFTKKGFLVSNTVISELMP